MKQELIRFYLQHEKVIIFIGVIILLIIVGQVQESALEMR